MTGARHRTSWAAALAGSVFVFLSGAHALAAAGETFPLPHTTFGTTGLLEMPSARMMPDGQLSVSASFMKNTQRYNFGFEVLPFLEVAFRYSGVKHQNFDPSLKTFYDRSFGVKLRLLDEGEYRPAVAIGAVDIVGTGIYGSEYLTATKRLFDDFDATVGIGWGRLGSTGPLPNPFGYLSQSFKTRPLNSPEGGTVGVRQLFHSPRTGLFGGVVWRTPIENLSLIAEYSSDRYVQEASFGTFRPHRQWNFGANYRLFNTMQIGVDWLYGESVGLTVSFDIDPTRMIYPERIAPAPVAPVIRDSKQQLQALEKLRNDEKESVAFAGGQPWVRLPVRPPQDAAARFVDEIMTASDDVRDVEIRGAQLIIATGRTGNTPGACQSYARLAAAYLRGVQAVALEDTAQSGVTCQAPPHDTIFVPELWQGTSLLDPVAISAGAAAAYAGESETIQAGNGNPPAPASGTHAAEIAIRKDAAEQSIDIEALSFSATDATVYFRNTRYGTDAEAIGRLVRVMMKDSPADIEIFHLISMDDGIPVQEYQVLRSPMERTLSQHGSPAEIRQAFSVRYPEMDTSILDEGRSGTYPRFKWSIFPEMRESFFDPNKPVRFAFLAGLSGSVEVVPGLSLDTTLEANIWNDFSSGRPSNSLLPHVRSDFVQYYKHGVNGIESLEASYRFRLTPSVFGIVKGGYLESMFGGVGGEVLWRPNHTRLALGADLYEVWQRKFDRLFGFQNYRVLTGHIAIYYASPWYGLNFRVLAGRYLAGDRGATFEITRRFSTGVEIGAFATFTNVPARVFGEGSFDKGIVIRIPFDWALPVSTQSRLSVDLRPLTRDGGQRLEGDTTLYDETTPTSYENFLQHLGMLTNP